MPCCRCLACWFKKIAIVKQLEYRVIMNVLEKIDCRPTVLTILLDFIQSILPRKHCKAWVFSFIFAWMRKLHVQIIYSVIRFDWHDFCLLPFSIGITAIHLLLVLNRKARAERDGKNGTKHKDMNIKRNMIETSGSHIRILYCTFIEFFFHVFNDNKNLRSIFLSFVQRNWITFS